MNAGSINFDTIYKIEFILQTPGNLQNTNNQRVKMRATSRSMILLSILISLLYLTQAEKTKTDSLQWWEEQLQAIKKKMREHFAKLYKSSDYNIAHYAPEEDVLIIGQNSQRKRGPIGMHFRRNTIKQDEDIQNAEIKLQYKQVSPQLRRLFFEWGVNLVISSYLRKQEDRKKYEKHLAQGQNFILLYYDHYYWTKIDDDPKEQLFLKQVADKVKEEYLRMNEKKNRGKQMELIYLLAQMKDLRALIFQKMEEYKQRRQKQIDLIHLLAEMKQLKTQLINKMEAYKQYLDNNSSSFNDL